MAYYYKIGDTADTVPLNKEFHLHKESKLKRSVPKITYDFSKHVLIELLDDTTPEGDLWKELGLLNNNSVIHKRMMIDSHRVKCRRAIVVCINSEEADLLSQRISQTKVVNRCVCAVVIEDLLSDLRLFEKQIVQFGDNRVQQQLLYVTDLSRSRGPSGLVKFLKETFAPFGTILSVLVCSDDDGYAFPEGVIKFAYLSEAFAAELAFDQFVVGKERLSVTTHHNILLAQCDLRVRLRDAQMWNNLNYSTSANSLFQSCNQTSLQNDLNLCSEGPVANSMANLQISNGNNDLTTNLTEKQLESTLPAFSQYNSKMNIPKKPLPENTTCLMSRSNRNEVSDLTNENMKNCDSLYDIANSDHFSHKTSLFLAETVPFDIRDTLVNTPSGMNKTNESQYHHQHISEAHLLNSEDIMSPAKKSFKTISDSDCFITCDNFPGSNSNCFSPSSKKNTAGAHLDDISIISKNETVISCSMHTSSSYKKILNGSEDVELSKNVKKRRKKFTPSQKLCLKSQRTEQSQNDTRSISEKSEILSSASVQLEKPAKKNRHARQKDLNLSTSLEPVGSSKVASWLSNIPVVQNIEPLSEKEVNVKVNLSNDKSILHEKRNRISVHGAPSMKSLFYPTVEPCNADSLSENEDPNKNPLILSNQDQSVPDLNKYSSPLQAWLKQELMSSTNNRAIKSQETSKSTIVCATRTKDVIIAVGCSHMTCESCYPGSTDLLLGFN